MGRLMQGLEFAYPEESRLENEPVAVSDKKQLTIHEPVIPQKYGEDVVTATELMQKASREGSRIARNVIPAGYCLISNGRGW